MARRMFYAWIIVFLPDFPVLQAFTFMLIWLPILAYHLAMNPYRDAVNNVFMNINEALIVFVGLFFFLFAEPHPGEDNEKKLAVLSWWVIGMIMLVMLFNILTLWVMKLTMIVKEFKEWLENFKNKPKPFKKRPKGPPNHNSTT
jgi:hypothetical protein